MFDVKKLADLPNLTTDQLKQLEGEIQSEFDLISKQFLQARLSRIKYMISNLGDRIEEIQTNGQNWNDVFGFESSAIENVKYNREKLCLSEKATIKDYDHELSELVRNCPNPLNFTPSLDFPFQSQFSTLIKTGMNDLNGVVNEKEYQLNNILENVERQKVIVWQNYRKDIINYKYHLFNKKLSRLSTLYKSHKNLDNTAKYARRWDNYHKPLASKNPRSDRSDPLGFIADKHNKFNRIETTNIKNNYLNQYYRFKANQARSGSAGEGITALSNCQGLTQSEIDEDMAMISAGSGDFRAQPESLAVVEEDEEVEEEQEQDDQDQEDNDHEHEIQDPVTPQQHQDSILQQQYAKLLAVPMINESFTIPELPSIEHFPLR